MKTQQHLNKYAITRKYSVLPKLTIVFPTDMLHKLTFFIFSANTNNFPHFNEHSTEAFRYSFYAMLAVVP